MSSLHAIVQAALRSGAVTAIAVGAFLAAVPPPVMAAGMFSVVPVRIYMTPRERAVAITVVNEGDSPIVLQAEINTWKQKPDGTDEQVGTSDLVLSPPIIKLAPKARQVVRLARVGAADVSQQLTYRLIIREVPELTAPKDPAIAIPISLALSMPVFITPPTARNQVSCDASRGTEGAVQVSCANTGTAYAQVREVQVRRSSQVVGRLEGGFYILPGARKALSVKAQQPVAAGPAELAITFDDGKSQIFPVVIP